jgi:DNA-binding SARP family transcriptional activator
MVTADRLIEDLWAGKRPAHSLATLRVYISRLRRVLGPQANILLTHSPGYRLNVDGDQLDAVRFERLARRGEAELTAGRADAAAATLCEALDLWRGPALSDVAELAFAQLDAARLEEARLTTLENRVEADLACGRHASLVAELDGLTSGHPLRERLTGQRILALYRCGRQADALAACDRLRRHLRDDLGIDLSPALRHLERDILVQAPPLAWDAASRSQGPSDSVARIEVVTALGRETFLLAAPRLSIGRDADNDVVIEGDTTVSRRHAEILRRGSTWVVRDFGSSNGTFLGGERIDGECLLRDGDELGVGDARLVLRVARRHGGGSPSTAEVTQQVQRGG